MADAWIVPQRRFCETLSGADDMRDGVNFLDVLFQQSSLRGSMIGSMEELCFGLTLLCEGTISRVLDRTFRLANVAEAHDYTEEHLVRAKIVPLPWDD